MNTDETESKVRNWLLNEKIRLCDSPYTLDGVSNLTVLKELAERIYVDTHLGKDSILHVLESLRARSVENVKAQENFLGTNEALIRIKLPPSLKSSSNPLRLQVNLTDMTGKNLTREIIAKLGVADESSLKLICQGKVLKTNLTLLEQGVKNGTQIMLLYSPITKESVKESETVSIKRMKKVEEVQQVVEYLCERAADNKFFYNDFQMDIVDQNGQSVALSASEKSALVRGLSLQNWSKTLLAKRNFEDALVFLLFADEAFSSCQQSLKLCSAVDNYSEIQLCIVWCFWQLERLTELADAERRLQVARTGLRATYGGKNLTLADEARYHLLQMRLHILSAVCAFYHNQETTALREFQLALDLFKRCQVREDLCIQIVAMGIKLKEAKYALFVCGNNIVQAVDFIYEHRKKMAALQAQDEENERQEHFNSLLGVTANGNAISVSLLDGLKSMGCSPELALQALRETNNNLEASMDLIMQDQEGLQIRIDSLRSSDSGIDVSGTTSTFVSREKRRELAEKLNKELHVGYYTAYEVLEKVQWDEESARVILIQQKTLDSDDDRPTSSRRSTNKDTDKEQKRHMEEAIHKYFRVNGRDSILDEISADLSFDDERNSLQRLALLLQVQDVDECIRK